jgi:hypothetical protein
MSSSRKTWISIVVALLIVFALAGLGIIGGGVYYVYRHVNARFASTESAAEEFAHEEARFAGQQALIEIREGDHPIVQKPTTSAPHAELQRLCGLAYDPRNHKLVRFNIPMWLLRLAPSRRMSFLRDAGDLDFDADRIHLTVDDLDRRGPGLILDHEDPRGTRVLVWTE